MRVPRPCLGRPAWVRASLDNYSFRGDSEETFQELTDNPHNEGHESGITQRLYKARWAGAEQERLPRAGPRRPDPPVGLVTPPFRQVYA